jgi:hypothetical protein
MIRFIRPFPFTILMLLILVAAAIWSRTHRGPLAPSIRQDVGFAPLHLPRGDWIKLFSCVFLTMGGKKFYASALMFGISVGATEKLYGTKSASVLFWTIHLVTLLIASLLVAIPLHAMDFYRGTLLANAGDVGPSAGYYGCLGAACAGIPFRWRAPLIGGVIAILSARLIWSFVTIPDHGRAMSADLSHLIAFPLGLLFATKMLIRPTGSL